MSETNLQYILWCINWLPTLMEIKSLSSDICPDKSDVLIKYIDVATWDTVSWSWRVEWACETNSIDPEVVCVSNDWGLTYIKAIAVFDISVNPPAVQLYDFNNTLLTWYTVVECNDAWYDIEKGWDFCLAWELISRYDIINSSTQLIEWSYWVDVLWVPQASPDPLMLWPRPCSEDCVPLLSVWTIASRWTIL